VGSSFLLGNFSSQSVGSVCPSQESKMIKNLSFLTCYFITLFCFFRTVIIKHRWCLAFWSSRFTFHCIRIHVLIYSLSRPTGNWLYLHHFLCSGLPLTKRNFPNNLTYTNFCGGLPPWKNKSNIQPPLHKNMKAIGQTDNKTYWKDVT
jgi:hypothetical protein